MSSDTFVGLSSGQKPGLDQEDFRPYLDAVRTASERTRYVFYVLMIAVIFTVAQCRDMTGWSSKRAQLIHRAIYSCVHLHDRNFVDTPIYRSARLALGVSDQESLDRAKVYDLELAKSGLALDRVQLPILGITIDTNDFGVASALSFLILLLVFRANQENEAKCFEIARRRAGLSPSSQELLSLTPVIVQPSLGKFHVIFLAVILLTPAYLTVWRAGFDSDSIGIGVSMIGWRAWLFVYLEWFLAACVTFAAAQATLGLSRKLKALAGPPAEEKASG